MVEFADPRRGCLHGLLYPLTPIWYQIRGVPIFYGYARKDKEIYPKEDAAAIRGAIKVGDQCYREYEAEHYFEPEFGAKSAPDVKRLMTDVVPWVLERFGR